MGEEREKWKKSQREEFSKMLAGMSDINFRFGEVALAWGSFGSWHFEFQRNNEHFRIVWDGKERCLLVEQRDESKSGVWVERSIRRYEQPSPEMLAVWMGCKKMLIDMTSGGGE